MKLNGDSIKDFFINHGEKVAVVAVGGVLVFGIYSLFTPTIYANKPENLKTASDTAKQFVATVKYVPPAIVQKAPDPRDIVNDTTREVDPGIFSPPGPLNPSADSGGEKRRQPVL